MMKKYLSLFFILLSMACSKKNRITELKQWLTTYEYKS